ncbi:hypothetical protein VRB95_03615 [Erwinia aphidicola]|uniref:hypothetical protein n=1 Tax=Erwinia aphidicola TaxID=68334 RepID=UPI0030CFCE4C
MKIEHSTVAELRREFMRNVVAPVVAVVVFALLGCGFTAYWVTAQSNAKAEEKQQQVIENIFAQHLADFGNQHKNLLKGADLLVQMAKPDEFGSWLYSLAGDNEIYLMDAQHRPIAAWLAAQPRFPAMAVSVSRSPTGCILPAGRISPAILSACAGGWRKWSLAACRAIGLIASWCLSAICTTALSILLNTVASSAASALSPAILNRPTAPVFC